MGHADGNINRLSWCDNHILTIERDFCGSLDNHPMLCSLGVLLVTQPLSGEHFNSLYLEALALIEDRKGAPGSAVEPW